MLVLLGMFVLLLMLHRLLIALVSRLWHILRRIKVALVKNFATMSQRSKSI